MVDVLEIRGLSVDFAGPQGIVHALRGVDLRVPAKTSVGIVGESGCGKTTVALAVMQLLAANAKVTAGEVMLAGRDVLKLSKEELRSCRGREAAMVFQDPMTAQNPVISIGKQMIDIQYRENHLPFREKRKRAIEMLRRVGIPDPDSRVDDFPHQFSGGMRQRISIAMALLMQPTLLIADEPTTALDVNTEAQIALLLRQLQKEVGAGMLFVSHNLGLVAELCDEMVVMYAGEVVEQGTTHDLFHNPKHPYTQRLLECDPALVRKRRRALPTIRGRVPDLRETPRGCVFAPRCHKALPRCHTEVPMSVQLSSSHQARCYLAAQRDALPWQPECRDAARQGERGDGRRSEQILLDIRKLRVRFRTSGPVKALLQGISDPYIDAVVNTSLHVHQGETLGLVGESGSGKTTLARCIVGLVRPHSGSIWFDGVELMSLSTRQYNRQRRKVAMMFQDPVASLSPRRTARALVMEPFEIHGIALSDPDTTAEKLFSMVGLSPAYFQHYPHELSGGQARRVGVARALALSPKLIVADEPTAGLDVSVQGEILNLMTDLKRKEGLSYLVISHNLPAIRHISDRVGVMYLGRLVEQGPVNDVIEAPAHPYTKALLDGIPHPDPDLRRNHLPIEGEVPSLMERPQGCEFHPRCPFAQGRCRREAPAERSISAQRRVRCHYPLN